jgi:hypothetical protein
VHVPNEERVHVFPVMQTTVSRPVKKGRTTYLSDPRPEYLVPDIRLFPDAVVTERDDIQIGGRTRDYRVARILLPGSQAIAAAGAIGAYGYAWKLLLVRVAHTMATVDDRRYTFVVDCAARKAAVFVWRTWCRGQGDWKVRPMHQVCTGCVAPLDLVVVGPERIVLVEHVVHPSPLDQAVGVVHPVGGRQEVIYRAVTIRTE